MPGRHRRRRPWRNRAGDASMGEEQRLSRRLEPAPRARHAMLRAGRAGPGGSAAHISRDRRHEMRKIRWLLAAMGAILAGLALVLGGTVSAGADPGTILKFDTMTPVTGPYVGSANPVRGVPGGGL